jgi:hypothetical protein
MTETTTAERASETMAEFAARLAITATVTRIRYPLACRNFHKHSWKGCPDCAGKATRYAGKDTDWKDSANEWRVTLLREGRSVDVEYWTGCGIKTAPNAADILNCLTSDAQMGEDSFEGFCGDMGLDTDSRKALDTYTECQQQGAKLRRILGNHAEYRKLLDDVERL